MVATHTERRALRASEVFIDHISMKLTVNMFNIIYYLNVGKGLSSWNYLFISTYEYLKKS